MPSALGGSSQPVEPRLLGASRDVQAGGGHARPIRRSAPERGVGSVPPASLPTPARASARGWTGPGARTRSLAETLLRRRLELDLTQDQVAERAGIAKSYVSQIENQTRKYPPSDEVIEGLERALELDRGVLQRVAEWETTPPAVRASYNQLLAALGVGIASGPEQGAGGGHSLARLDELHRSGQLARLVAQIEGHDPAAVLAPESGTGRDARGARTHSHTDNRGVGPVEAFMPAEIPLINSVAAGYPCEFTDLGYPARVAAEYVRSMDVRDRDGFAARVVGDSMTPDYREGDIVVFSPARPIQSGMDCFVRLEPDHESTFKRVFFDAVESAANDGAGDAATGSPVSSESPGSPGSPGSLIRLHPLNPRYPVRVVPREQVAGLYAAVSVTRTLG